MATLQIGPHSIRPETPRRKCANQMRTNERIITGPGAQHDSVAVKELSRDFKKVT